MKLSEEIRKAIPHHRYLVTKVQELEAQIPQWISVKDRLPEKSKFVLVKESFCDEIQIAYWIGKDCVQWIEQHENHYCNGDADCEFYINRVTHWMPLPEAPKEE